MTTRNRSRGIVIAVAVCVVAILGVGFWFAAQFQSVAQQEADAKAPPAGPVFAEVTRGTLAGEVGFTGEIGPSARYPVTVLPAADVSRSVVTGRPLDAGATTSSGQVITEVNGRPLFGVHSPFAFYRDIGVGDRGPDVEALQRALVSRSYLAAADGLFGSGTARAVWRWYEDSGYVAPLRSTSSTAVPRSSEPVGPGAEAPVAPPQESYVPIAELVALPSTSAQVVEGVRIGQELGVEGAVDFVLGSADLVVTVATPVGSLGDVGEGDEATISVNGSEIDGVVGEVRSTEPMEGAVEGDEPIGQDAVEVVFVVTPHAALPAASGRATVSVITQVVAHDALLVPVLAVSDRGSGKNVLTARREGGELTEVPVTVLGTLDGEVAVVPTKAAALEVGDQVRVG